MIVLRAAVALAFLLAVPSVAQAGTVTRNGGIVVYTSSAGGDSVNVGTELGMSFVDSNQPINSNACGNSAPTRVDCPNGTGFQVTFVAGAENSVDGSQVQTTEPLTATGGPTDDRLTGTRNPDILTGGSGSDNLAGGEGNDTLDGGPGPDYFDDGAGDDEITGGPDNDSWTAGPGRDSFTPGDGSDRVSYEGRTNPVTITFNGLPDDGEAGEGDNVGADAEEATGGNGNDLVIGNNLGNTLNGGAGNDTITGGTAEDRLVGNEGNDTIDSRDGRFDSVDCGPGSDVVYADPGDTTENCEVAPDRDGDGTLNEQDCAPDNAAVHPGAGEIIGNNVDEDCSGGPGYLRVISPVSFSTNRDARRNRAQFTKFSVGEVKAGDKIEIRCTSKSKGCPFAKKSVTGKAGKRTVSVLSYFKKRFLRKGAVVEVRTTRPNEIGAVRRLTVGKKGNMKLELLCLPPGAAKPARCV